jgi:CrcB protein
MMAAAHSPDLSLALAVTAAGAVGALLRTFLNDAVAHRTATDFPLGILSVNVVGSFALGLLTGLAWYHGLSASALTFAGVGLCGGFTTWSTSIWETMQLLRLRRVTEAGIYTVGGLAIAIGAAAAGIGVAALV